MRKSVVAMAAALALVVDQAGAAAVCDRPADAMALETAALQQELMVAALVCKSVAAYNDFVTSHQGALRASDKVLLHFFTTANPRRGDDDYNLYKTDLANAASLRSMHDSAFCQHARTNFSAAEGRPLQQVLAVLPYPVATGPYHCRLMEAAKSLQTPETAKNELQRSAQAGE